MFKRLIRTLLEEIQPKDLCNETSNKEGTQSVKSTACVLTHGCPESRIDSAKVQTFLKKNHYKIVEDPEEADLILFRTCGLTKGSVLSSLNAIKEIESRMKKGAKLIPWGCLSEIQPDALKKYTTFGDRKIGKINKILDVKVPIEEVNANFLLPNYEECGVIKSHISIPKILSTIIRIKQYPIIKEDKYGRPFYIKTSTGCLGSCTFCAVRLSRGPLKSKPINKVLSEFKAGWKMGYRDFRLLGTDVGAYGRDQGYTLVDLLNKMTEIEGHYAISLRNLEPHWVIEMYKNLKPIFSSGKIRLVSVPFESGSNRILRLMGRKYTIERYVSTVQDISVNYPKIMLDTQAMVGFPTETEKDFRQTEKVLRNIPFDFVEVYKFSPRSGTIAANIYGQVPEYVKTVRQLRLVANATVNMIARNIKTLTGYIVF